MVEKGKRYEVKVHDFSHQGEGVARIDGLAVFIHGVLPGEKAVIRITEKKKNFARGVLLELITHSPERRHPPCPVYERCGGCQLQHLSDSAQLDMKRHKVMQALQRIGAVQEPVVKETWGMDDPWRYRSKVQFQVRDSRLGYYGAGTHHFVPIDDCLLLPQDMILCKKNLEAFLRREPIHPEMVVLKKSHKVGQLQAIFYGPPMGHHHMKVFGEKLSAEPHLSSSGWVEQVSGRYFHLHGPDVLEEEILGLNYRISPLAFVQVNHSQMENLYNYALQKMDILPTDLVLDLYCGIGSLTCLVGKQAKKVIGIDEVHGAIVDGQANAILNGLENVTFLTGKVEALLPELLAGGMVPDVVILDPPRAGVKPEVLDAIQQTGPRSICYISCDPATLARDVGRLCAENHYTINVVKPIDLFPQTFHVECVVLMSRVEK